MGQSSTDTVFLSIEVQISEGQTWGLTKHLLNIGYRHNVGWDLRISIDKKDIVSSLGHLMARLGQIFR